MSIALLSAKIYTNDKDNPMAQAVLIENNKIIALGSNTDIENLCSEHTKKIHLPGRFITPGLVDSHTHAWSLGYTLTMVDLRGLTSIKACQKAIAAAAQTAGPGDWIIGRNWNQNIWEEQRDPDRHDLDLAAPDNPAVMIRICGHANWCNTKAFELAGINAHTPDPFGGKIDREADTNMPAGVIRETRQIVEDFIPAPSFEMRKKAFLNAQNIFLENGITCVHSFETLEEYKVIHALEQDGDLKIRVYHSLPPEELEAFDKWDQKNPPQTDFLWHGHTKMFADGSLGAKSAFMHEPYTGSSNNCGIACMTLDQMQKDIELSYRLGRGVIFHAIGDRGLTQSLDAIEQARKNMPGTRRDRIEHIQIARPKDLERMKAMDIAASVQPMAILTDWKVAEEIWGKERCKNSYAWKTMEDIGLRLIFSSDAPIEPLSPVQGIQAAVTRQDFEGKIASPWYPEQKLSVETALKAYFDQAGWTTGKQDLFGSISVGKMADLTVLSRDPFAVPDHEIKDIQIEMTIVDGKIVFQNK